MKKASVISVLITTFFYLGCGCFGYAAFGDNTPGNIVAGSGFYEPFWLLDFANACIILHLIGGYQIYSQPIYALVDRWVPAKFPNNKYVNMSSSIRMPLSSKPFKLSLLRVVFRTTYVVTATALAIIFPYFNQVLGILGALNFWPLAIYFPVQMYLLQKKIPKWSSKWIALEILSGLCLALSIFALAGSVEGVVKKKLG